MCTYICINIQQYTNVVIVNAGTRIVHIFTKRVGVFASIVHSVQLVPVSYKYTEYWSMKYTYVYMDM